MKIENLLPQFKSGNSTQVTQAVVSRKEIEMIIGKIFDDTLEVVAEMLESYHDQFSNSDVRKELHRLHGEIYAKELRKQKRSNQNGI